MSRKNRAINQARWCTRIAGLLAFILGMQLRKGALGPILRLHMTLGVVVALVLVLMSIAALSRRLQSPLPFIGLVFAALTVFIGLTQNRLLPGDMHWVIEVFHLLLGVAAIGCTEALGGALSRMPERA